MKNHHAAKFQITDPPIVWVSEFPCVNKNGILGSVKLHIGDSWGKLKPLL